LFVIYVVDVDPLQKVYLLDFLYWPQIKADMSKKRTNVLRKVDIWHQQPGHTE
jgi:hypothetical protein